MSNTFSNDDKLFLIKRISNIKLKKHKKKYYIQLFNIINKNNIKYTKNLNGIFFNLNNVDNNILVEIDNFLDNIENCLDESDTDTTTTDN